MGINLDLLRLILSTSTLLYLNIFAQIFGVLAIDTMSSPYRIILSWSIPASTAGFILILYSFKSLIQITSGKENHYVIPLELTKIEEVHLLFKIIIKNSWNKETSWNIMLRTRTGIAWSFYGGYEHAKHITLHNF